LTDTEYNVYLFFTGT